VFSREALTVVNNLRHSEEDRNNAETIIAAIKQHVDGHINESIECFSCLEVSVAVYL